MVWPIGASGPMYKGSDMDTDNANKLTIEKSGGLEDLLVNLHLGEAHGIPGNTQQLDKKEGSRLYTANAAKYKAVLNHLGYDLQLNSLISIDRSGFSPDIASELGEDYLGHNIIILDMEQGKASLLRNYNSELNRLLDKVYTEMADLIGYITPHEALYGRVELLVIYEIRFTGDGLLEDYYPLSKSPLAETLNIRHSARNQGPSGLSIEFDTVTQSVKKIKQTIESINALNSTPNLILDTKYLKDVAAKAKELNKTYGNIKSFVSKTEPVELKIDWLKIQINRNKYYIAASGNFIVFHFGDKLYPDDHAVFTNPIHDEIINALWTNGCLKLDIEKVEKMLKIHESDLLKEYDLVSENLIKQWATLRDRIKSVTLDCGSWKNLCKLYASASMNAYDQDYFFRLPFEIKKAITKLSPEYQIFSEIL